jgi:eukaryotic-like serine/threonine-protein kinase
MSTATPVPTIRALLALNRGDPANAIELLKIAKPYELAVPATAYDAFFGSLFPAYVRGEAYRRMRRGRGGYAKRNKPGWRWRLRRGSFPA